MRHGKGEGDLWVQIDLWMEATRKTIGSTYTFSFYVRVFMGDSTDMYVPHMSALTVHSPFALFKAGSLVGCLRLSGLVHRLQESLLPQPPASGWSTGIVDGLCCMWLVLNLGNPHSCDQTCSTNTSHGVVSQPQALESQWLASVFMKET